MMESNYCTIEDRAEDYRLMIRTSCYEVAKFGPADGALRYVRPGRKRIRSGIAFRVSVIKIKSKIRLTLKLYHLKAISW